MVGVGYGNEFLGCLGLVIWIAIGMPCFAELVEGFLDFLQRCVGLNLQSSIVVIGSQDSGDVDAARAWARISCETL